MSRRVSVLLLAASLAACSLKDDSSSSATNSGSAGGSSAATPPAAAPGAIPAPPDVAAVPPDAQKAPDGLAWRILKPGAGSIHPTAASTVTVHYTGWSTDGQMFDSSVARNEPATFPLDNVIKGWTEGVQMMVLGEKRRFWIPGKLAYDAGGGPPGAPKGMLVFDIELLDIK